MGHSICSCYVGGQSVKPTFGAFVFGSTPPGASRFFRVPQVFLPDSVFARSRVMPNTANVLMRFLWAAVGLTRLA